MPSFPSDRASVPELTEIYREVIGKVSEELCKEYLKITGPLNSDFEEKFKKNLKNLIVHARKPGFLLRTSNAIENHTQTIKAITKHVIPFTMLLGFSYYCSRFLTNAVDIGLGAVIKFVNAIVAPFDLNDSIQEESSAFHHDAVKTVGTISTILILFPLYILNFQRLLATIFRVSTFLAKKAIAYKSGPNPPNIISRFSELTEFQGEFAWILYSLLFIHDDKRNTKECFKKIFSISKEDEQQLNEAMDRLHDKFYAVYKKLIKPYTVSYPKAFNKRGEAKDEVTFKIVLREYLETIILIPAHYLSNKNYYTNSYLALILTFLEPINVTKNTERSREINSSIDNIAALLKGTDSYEESSVSRFQQLVNAFNGLFTLFRDNPSDGCRSSNHNLLCNQIFIQLKKFTEEIRKLPITNKEIINLSLNSFLQEANNFLEKSVFSTANHNCFLPWAINLLHLFNSINTIQREFSTSTSSQSANNTDFTITELNQFLTNISRLLVKVTEKLANSSTSGCAGTSAGTLSELELTNFLWTINDFLRKFISDILSAQASNQTQTELIKLSFSDNIHHLLEEFVNILVNTPSKQSDPQSGKNIGWEQLENLQKHINSLQREFPSSTTKLAKLHNKLEGIISRFKSISTDDVVIQMELDDEIKNSNQRSRSAGIYAFFQRLPQTIRALPEAIRTLPQTICGQRG